MIPCLNATMQEILILIQIKNGKRDNIVSHQETGCNPGKCNCVELLVKRNSK